MKLIIYNSWNEPAVTHEIVLEDAKEEGPSIKEQIDEELKNFKFRLYSYVMCPGCLGTGRIYISPTEEEECYMCNSTGKKSNIAD